MFIDHKKKFAAASASFCVRSAVVFALILGSLGAGIVRAEGPDGGGPQRRDPPPQQQQGSASRSSSSDQRSSDARSLERYEARTEEQRRQLQEASHNAEVNRRMNRMTPDERRDLRRQINEVGQDLYALPPRR